MEPAQKLIAFYENLGRGSVADLKDVYSTDVVFVDPVATHRGLAQLEGYFSRLLKDCEACSFKIHHASESQSETFIRWTMKFAHRKLKGGQPVSVEGLSTIKVEHDKVTYQRDFYDMGAMIYENVPVIGRIVTGLKTRLAA